MMLYRSNYIVHVHPLLASLMTNYEKLLKRSNVRGLDPELSCKSVLFIQVQDKRIRLEL